MDTARERIVVTGLGMVTPCGTGVTETWDNLLAGRSGIGLITAFDASEFAVRIAGEVKDWDPSVHIPKKKVRELGRFAQFAVASAQLAVRDAGLELTEQERENAACVMGVGMGGLEGLERVSEVIREKGPSKVSPYAVPTIAMNMAAGQISIALGIHGPSFCTASACASGAHAIGEALMLLRAGAASVAIAGGAEATITPTGIAGFQAMFALSRRNDDPKGACRPFDTQRDGFVAS
ncbi:MAG TPA: beta-ketoacyl synthase N-terminal-like domain-containing protein, partial [Polyangiaceae bacterium]|nr:beta-ketoacyl synthase N-terminal-like domain-containing protein [Polyangiaceae bacterium]